MQGKPRSGDHGPAARIAVARVWQDDLLEPGKCPEHIRTSGDALATVLRSLGQGLAANPALQAGDGAGAAGDRPGLPGAGERRPLPANARACELPARIDAAAWGAQLPKGDAGHVVLVLAITEKTVSPQPTVWGIGPGGMPGLYHRDLDVALVPRQAHVYDAATGELLTKASAIDGSTGAYGVMMTVIPYYAAPVPSQFLDTMADAVGAELARRFRRRMP